jgi:hypothetical protein
MSGSHTACVLRWGTLCHSLSRMSYDISSPVLKVLGRPIIHPWKTIVSFGIKYCSDKTVCWSGLLKALFGDPFESRSDESALALGVHQFGFNRNLQLMAWPIPWYVRVSQFAQINTSFIFSSNWWHLYQSCHIQVGLILGSMVVPSEITANGNSHYSTVQK